MLSSLHFTSKKLARIRPEPDRRGQRKVSAIAVIGGGPQKLARAFFFPAPQAPFLGTPVNIQ
jgi:NADPH-dependent glutamate synthase beta subunit-like oxidoreductase